MTQRICHSTIHGFAVIEDRQLGLLSVEHDGAITWDDLQGIKNAVWGHETRAIEVYPAQSQLVNGATMRHLWRLGRMDFCPDLVGEDGHQDDLQTRYSDAWSEARR